MTAQPYAPQYPVPPQPQPYPQQAYPAQQPPVYQAPPQAYPPQGYAPQQAPQQPTVPLANGTLDDYYSQPTGSAGPGISWKDKPIGTSYAGVVTRDVTNGDVIQDTDFTTKQPKFYSDGRPVFVMKVPLRNAPTQEFPDGEFGFYVRGQAREELARAMSEAGVQGAPKAGDVIQVTLVQRKPSRRGGNPANIVQIAYTPAGGQAPAQQQAPAVQPAAQPVPQVPAAQPVAQPAPQVQPVQQQAPVQQYAPQAPVQQQVVAPAYPVAQPAAQPAVPQAVQPVAQPAPQVQPAAAPAVPAGLSDEQAQLLARLTGQAQA